MTGVISSFGIALIMAAQGIMAKCVTNDETQFQMKVVAAQACNFHLDTHTIFSV